MKIHAPLVALAVLAAAAPALAETLKVPSQYASIQEAVDDAKRGDTVAISAGTYTEDVDLDGKNGLTIRGVGKVTFDMGSSINIHGNSTEITVRSLAFNDSGGITVIGGGEIVLTRLDFTGGVTSIGSSGVLSLVISKCSFQGTSGRALGEIDSIGYVVEKCVFEDIADYAVLLSPDGGTGTQSPVLSKNRLVNCVAGFALSGANAVVEKNRMEGLESYGVNTTGFVNTTGARISKNRISTTGAAAIGGAYNTFTVEKNILVGGGIQFSGSNHFIDHNSVTSANGTAISVTGVATIKNNTVKGANGAGIQVQGAATVIEHNSVADTNAIGIQVSASDCTIAKNTVARADTFGIFISGTGVEITGNRSTANGQYDLVDTSDEGVNLYVGNHFGTTFFNYID